MRLHKHAELVEAIHNVISPWVSGHDIARAALDALLEAAVELGVGEVGIPDTVTWFAKTAEPALILRMEASDDA